MRALQAIKKIPIDLYYLFAASLLLLLGILPAKELMNSLANEATLSFVSLFVLSNAIIETNLFHAFVAKVLEKIQKKRILLPFFSGILGGFFNPSLRLQQFLPSTLFYPILVGGACTLMGSLPALISAYLVKKAFPEASLNVFELALIGLPCLLAASLYAYADGSAVWPFAKVSSNKEARKEWFILLAFFSMIALCAYGFSLAASSFCAAIFLLLFKFVPWKLLQSFPLELLLLTVSAILLGTAIEQTFLAEKIASFFPKITDPHLLIATIYLLGFAFSHFLFPIAVVPLLFPIALQVLHFAGFEGENAAKAAAFTLAMAANFAFLKNRKGEIPAFSYGGSKDVRSEKKMIFLCIVLFLFVVGLVPIYWMR